MYIVLTCDTGILEFKTFTSSRPCSVKMNEWMKEDSEKSFNEDLIDDCPIKTIAFLFQDDSWMHRELDTYK